MEVQLDLPGRWVGGRPALLTQLQTQQQLHLQQVTTCGQGRVVSAYLLVPLRVALPDGPGSGSDQPAPHLRAILPRHAGTQQSFEFR